MLVGHGVDVVLILRSNWDRTTFVWRIWCSRLDVMEQQVSHQPLTFKTCITQRPRNLSTLPIRLYAESNDECTHTHAHAILYTTRA